MLDVTLHQLLRTFKRQRRLVEGYVEHYNSVRLNSAIGYITPKDMLAGCQQEIHSERDRRLVAARQQRQIRRRQAERRTSVTEEAKLQTLGAAYLVSAGSSASRYQTLT